MRNVSRSLGLAVVVCAATWTTYTALRWATGSILAAALITFVLLMVVNVAVPVAVRARRRQKRLDRMLERALLVGSPQPATRAPAWPPERGLWVCSGALVALFVIAGAIWYLLDDATAFAALAAMVTGGIAGGVLAGVVIHVWRLRRDRR